MPLLEIGNWAYQIGAVGIVAFTLSFLFTVRWWTDFLGKIIAGVFFTMSAILTMSTIRLANPDIGGQYYAWRAVVFSGFAIAVWTGLGTFIWSQFLAPRVKVSRMTTRKEFRNESEVDLGSDGRDRDRDSDDDSGRVH